MSIDEAIKHAREVADCCKSEISTFPNLEPYERYCNGELEKCAEEQEQLAEWLEELKEYRENIGILIGKEKGKAYKQGRQDAIEDFKKYLLRHKHLVSEYETNYKYEAVKIEFITDTNDLFLAEQMKEGAENGF